MILLSSPTYYLMKTDVENLQLKHTDHSLPFCHKIKQ